MSCGAQDASAPPSAGSTTGLQAYNQPSWDQFHHAYLHRTLSLSWTLDFVKPCRMTPQTCRSMSSKRPSSAMAESPQYMPLIQKCSVATNSILSVLCGQARVTQCVLEFTRSTRNVQDTCTRCTQRCTHWKKILDPRAGHQANTCNKDVQWETRVCGLACMEKVCSKH